MKYLIALSIIVSFTSVFANSEGEAVKALSKALPKVPEVKKVTKKVEEKLVNIVENYTPMNRDTAGFVFSSAIIASQGKVSTRPLKNFQVELFNEGVLRPDIEYDFNEQKTKTTISTSWDW